MIDDLITKGASEPYRLLTSRAEYRLLLRHDNADIRLMEIGHRIGLLPEERYVRFLRKLDAIATEKERLRSIRIHPEEFKEVFNHIGMDVPTGVISLDQLLKRPQVSYTVIDEIAPLVVRLDEEIRRQVEIDAKYQGYVAKQTQEIERQRRMEDKKLSVDLDYRTIKGLSNEGKDRLSLIKPTDIGQASRIEGVTPADISVLLIWLEFKSRQTVNHE